MLNFLLTRSFCLGLGDNNLEADIDNENNQNVENLASAFESIELTPKGMQPFLLYYLIIDYLLVKLLVAQCRPSKPHQKLVAPMLFFRFSYNIHFLYIFNLIV